MRDELEYQKLLAGLKMDLTPEIIKGLEDPKIFEIILNHCGTLWYDGVDGMYQAGTVNKIQAYNIIMDVSGILSHETHSDNPILEGEFPLGGRFEALIPPVVSSPSFCLRKFTSSIFDLNSYVKHNIITSEQKEIIVNAVLGKKNILIAGSTGSGKTTLTNAVMLEIPKDDRLITIEDTNELQINNPNWLGLRTSLKVDMVGLLKATMRLRPDRIIVGEVRDKSAHALLKAWNTGHPGGVATLHANSCEDALWRLNSLVEEAGVLNQQKLISRAVDMVIFIQKTSQGRKVTNIQFVQDYDGLNFIIEDVYKDEQFSNNVVFLNNQTN
jgi:type IV secretion system protein VirB11